LPLTIEQLQAQVRDRHPCHHVVLTPTADSVYIFRLSPQGTITATDRYPMSRSSLTRLVSEYNRALGTGADPDPEVTTALNQLLTHAVSPIPSQTPLVVVPSGPLMQLPFLSTSIDGELLVRRNTVTVLPSLSLLGYLHIQGSSATVAAAVYGDALSDLPAARDEARWVARRFGTRPILGPAVTRAAALAGFPRAHLVHVAGHAEYRAATATQAGFVLADRTILSGRDLLESRLAADLVFLSGCETGRLAVDPGDELTGLPVGFIRSGVPCIVTAAWRISDDATKRLVKAFYRASTQEPTFAAALRAAQLDMLGGSRYRHPYFWAGFQLWGSATVGPKQGSAGHRPTLPQAPQG
jgi:CHAT domain-containing protein